MAVKQINSSELSNELKDGITIVNLFGTWCGACKMFAPVLDDLSNELPVYKIDIDLNREFTNEMEVQAVPTTLIYKDGKLADKVLGFIPKNNLLKKIEEL